MFENTTHFDFDDEVNYKYLFIKLYVLINNRRSYWIPHFQQLLTVRKCLKEQREFQRS